MKVLTFLLVLLLLFTAACSRKPSEGGSSSPSAGELTQTVDAAAEMLQELAKQPSHAIPDTILNRTRCVAIVPSSSSRHTGLATCRVTHDKWTEPEVVTFKPAGRELDADLLVLVLTRGGALSLKGGELKLGGPPSSTPGITLRQTTVVTDAELTQDALVYARDGQSFQGVQANGTLRTRKIWPRDPANRKQNASSLVNAGVSEDREKRFTEGVTSYFNSIIPTGIMIHHSGVIPAREKVPGNVDEVDEFHSERGFDISCFGRHYNVAYHYLILPNGAVQAGRPERCAGAHARGYNSYIGISVVGDFSSDDNPAGAKGPKEPTPQQMRAMADVTRRLMSHYNIPLQRVMRHSDVSSTSCPGDNFPFNELLAELR